MIGNACVCHTPGSCDSQDPRRVDDSIGVGGPTDPQHAVTAPLWATGAWSMWRTRRHTRFVPLTGWFDHDAAHSAPLTHASAASKRPRMAPDGLARLPAPVQTMMATYMTIVDLGRLRSTNNANRALHDAAMQRRRIDAALGPIAVLPVLRRALAGRFDLMGAVARSRAAAGAASPGNASVPPFTAIPRMWSDRTTARVFDAWIVQRGGLRELLEAWAGLRCVDAILVISGTATRYSSARDPLIMLRPAVAAARIDVFADIQRWRRDTRDVARNSALHYACIAMARLLFVAIAAYIRDPSTNQEALLWVRDAVAECPDSLVWETGFRDMWSHADPDVAARITQRNHVPIQCAAVETDLGSADVTESIDGVADDDESIEGARIVRTMTGGRVLLRRAHAHEFPDLSVVEYIIGAGDAPDVDDEKFDL